MSVLLHWHNSRVSVTKGVLGDLRAQIPEFERRPFGFVQPHRKGSRAHPRLDSIIRKPVTGDEDFVPVGLVSRAYALVPHRDVLDQAAQTIEQAGILGDGPGAEGLQAELRLTEFGERMSLSVFLPDHLAFTPADGHPVSMRLECFNSVEGSCQFQALLGWFRLVCENGLVIGVTQSRVARRHVGDLGLRDLARVVANGLADSVEERRNFEIWFGKKVDWTKLARWADSGLKTAWGFKAATRAWHIANTGHDAEITGAYRDSTPTSIDVHAVAPVPGAREKAENLYDLSQILAWLARYRKDTQEQLAWREQIGDLLKPLLN